MKKELKRKDMLMVRGGSGIFTRSYDYTVQTADGFECNGYTCDSVYNCTSTCAWFSGQYSSNATSAVSDSHISGTKQAFATTNGFMPSCKVD